MQYQLLALSVIPKYHTHLPFNYLIYLLALFYYITAIATYNVKEVCSTGPIKAW